jgi:hypothetical protein
LTDTNTEIVRFKAGKTYQCRSLCDWDTIVSFVVVSRTAKMLTIRERGIKPYRRGIFVLDGVEKCKPHGTYSMCPVISADRESV